MNQVKTILLTALITAVVVGGSLYAGYQLGNQSKMAIPSEKSPKVMQENKENTVEKVAMTSQPDCKIYGDEWIPASGHEKFSFCYKGSWGSPEVKLMNVDQSVGQLFRIEFANTKFTDDGPDAPDVWYETPNYELLSDHDGAMTCFGCINFDKTISENIEAIHLFGASDSSKTKVGEKQAIRSYYKEGFVEGESIDMLGYYIPNAFADYHLQMSIGALYASDLDAFAKTIRFK